MGQTRSRQVAPITFTGSPLLNSGGQVSLRWLISTAFPRSSKSSIANKSPVLASINCSITRESITRATIAPDPGASDAVCGLINLRGTIVTVIDGGRALDLQAFARDEGLILIVDYFDRWLGIGVDDVRDIQDVPIDQFAMSDGSEIPVPGVATGVVEIEGRRVVVLDIKTVIQQVIGQGR